jgi:hypothetical protein
VGCVKGLYYQLVGRSNNNKDKKLEYMQVIAKNDERDPNHIFNKFDY